jgi:DNA-binding beta-propeller fold protein YncE
MNRILTTIIILLIIQFGLAQSFIEDRRFGQNNASNDIGKFNTPQAISISENKILYVVDTGNNRIQLFDLNGEFIKSIGGFGFSSDKFDHPTDIWVRSLINIYISDYNNHRIQRYDGNMNYLSSLTSNDGLDVQFQFYEIASCAVNSQQDLFVLDYSDAKIIKYNRNGQPERVFGDYESGDGQLVQPVQIDILAQKYIIVSDIDHKAIKVYDFFGNYMREIISDLWMAPSGLTITNRNEILVADPIAKKIFIISADFAAVKEIGLVLQKSFSKPQDLAIFSKKVKDKIINKLYIIDNNNIIIGNFINP